MESLARDAHDSEAIRKHSTEAEPYHFVGSGLENVYLVGVDYEVTRDGLQAADIPCLPKLMQAIGKVLVEKKTPLSADEVRFLRKRLRMTSKGFAALVGMTAEQYSRLENGATVTPTVERVIRLIYATLAKLSIDESREVATVIWTAELNHEEHIVACREGEDGWVVLTRAA